MPVILRALCAALFAVLLIAPSASAQATAPNLTRTVLTGEGPVNVRDCTGVIADSSFKFSETGTATRPATLPGSFSIANAEVVSEGGRTVSFTEPATISVSGSTIVVTAALSRSPGGNATFCDEAGGEASELLTYSAEIVDSDKNEFTDNGTSTIFFASRGQTGGELKQTFLSSNTAGAIPTDTDGDFVNDGNDNCRGVNNPDQKDRDGDGTGDLCDPDNDNDGVADGADSCVTTANDDQADSDGDGVGNACDTTTTEVATVDGSGTFKYRGEQLRLTISVQSAANQSIGSCSVEGDKRTSIQCETIDFVDREGGTVVLKGTATVNRVLTRFTASITDNSARPTGSRADTIEFLADQDKKAAGTLTSGDIVVGP